MSNVWSFWLHIYFCALESATENHPTLYSSRIDGAVLPYYGEGQQETIVVENTV